MQNLQSNNYGCQELDLQTARDVNGGLIDFGLLKLDFANSNGKINLGITADPNGLTGNLPGGGGLPGLGGLGSLLSPVTSLLNSLLGSLGGGVLGL